MAGFFPQFAFPFPPSILSTLFLKFFPYLAMSSVPFTVTLPTNALQFEEVWGMESKDFYGGSNAMVRMVKCSWIVMSLPSHL